jgi:DNA-binding MarR family transcriptional regulator
MYSMRKEQSLGYQVNLLARLLERALRDRIAAHGVVPGQFPALLSLFEEDGLTQAQLAALVQIEQPTIAKTLQRMERDGLIERTPDPDDGRRVRVFLTSRARALERDLKLAAREINERAVIGLTPARQELLAEMIKVVIANLSGSDSSSNH